MAAAAPQVLLVLEAPHLEVRGEGGPQRGGEHGHAVLSSFSVAHDDLAAGEVDVLDAQAAAFHQPQAGAVEQAGHEPGRAFDPADDGVHLGARQDDRKAGGPAGARHAFEPFELPVQDLLEEEHQRGERLVLGRRADAAIRGEVREICGDLALPHVVGVALAVMQDELPHPADVRLFGPGAEMAAADLLADQIEQFRLEDGRRLRGRLADGVFEHAPSPFGGAEIHWGRSVGRIIRRLRGSGKLAGTCAAGRMTRE
jgi:hypothetical protein